MRSLLELAALGVALLSGVRTETLCSTTPITYPGAKEELIPARWPIDMLLKYGVATWVSDRIVNGDASSTVQELVTSCPEDSRLSVVLYALPNKDCSAGFSNGNASIVTGDDYAAFVTELADLIGDRKVLYVLEPDAVGLIVSGGCAIESDYQGNLTTAVSLLSTNPNAEIYVDVGYWTLSTNESAAQVAKVVKELSRNGTVKGITLNTSNYRPTPELVELCSNFQAAINSTDMHCIIDTSRNYQSEYSNATSSEWCNSRYGGIGIPPTDDTGYDNIDYFLYIKPPGESDGYCTNQSSDALRGPEAGTFYYEHFIKLWNHGYFTIEQDNIRIFDESDSAATRWSAPLISSLVVAIATLVVV